MDWGSILAAAITGVVGIAGIGGSFLSAKLAGKSATQDLQTSIGAESERVRLVEKRRIYARYQASLDSLILASARPKVAAGRPGLGSGLAELGRALGEVLSSLGELKLIAPEPLGQLAQDAASAVVDLADNSIDADDRGKIPRIRKQLYDAMRADLGEPVAEQPDIAQSSDPASGGG